MWLDRRSRAHPVTYKTRIVPKRIQQEEVMSDKTFLPSHGLRAVFQQPQSA